MKELHTIELTEGGPIASFQGAVEQAMQKDIDHFKQEMAKLRTGRAHPALVEDLIVSCYGTAMKLKEIASISAPEAQMLVIQPWDKNLIGDIEKAITTSDLGINPVNDGTVIRLQMPHMTKERREELIRVLHKKLEECRIGMRNVREAARRIIKDAQKNKRISEDYERRLNELLQKITSQFVAKAEELAQKKEAEIRHL